MKILAVDMSSVMRRFWEAGDGKDFGEARQRAVKTILGHADGFDRLAIALDRAPSFRRVFLPSYKDNRLDPGEAYRDQLKMAIAELRETGATVWYSPSLGRDASGADVFGEGDDVLASLALWYQEKRGEDWSLRILSSDTDLWALVDDELAIDLMTLEGKRITVNEVVERFGVSPHLVPEVKALAGDKSDGYKTFEHPEKDAKGNAKAGVGEGYASKILLSTIEPGDGEPSRADAVIRAVLADADPGCSLPAPVIFCIKHHGAGALDLGRKLAQLRPLLVQKTDGLPDTLDFSKILAEPVPVPRKSAPQYSALAPAAAPAAPEPVLPAEPKADALALRPAAFRSDAMDRFALEPRDMSEAMRLAGEMYNSGLFRNLPNAPACLMVIGQARNFGVSAFLAAARAHVIKGRLGYDAQFLMAVVRMSPLCKVLRFDMKRCTEDRAVLLFWHRNDPEQGEAVFTIEMARKAGYLGGGYSEQWTKRPGQQLKWAVVRETVRAVWPEVIGGIYGPDELARGEMADGGEFPPDMITMEA